MLIAQLSDLHVGGSRHDDALLRTAIAEVNEAEPDLVVIAGDITDEGYPDQYELAAERLGAISCPRVVVVPGNHDARHVGYLQFERTFGARDTHLRLSADGTRLALVAVDSSKPDLDEGEIGREHYAWIDEGFADPADVRVFVCHHHLMPIPGTGRERNQVLDAGDVLAVLRRSAVDLVLGGHRHVPYVWPVAGMLLVHSGTASTLRTRAFTEPAYNVIRLEPDLISIELRVPGRRRQRLGEYPRAWPAELSSSYAEPFDHVERGPGLAND
jgi:3',5'-cyclic-AMP phosphodiesterase